MLKSLKEWFLGTAYTIGTPHLWFRRFILFPYQRVTRGFDDSVTWDLQSTIAEFALPRLRLFKERVQGHPAHLEEAEWNEILDKMIWALEYVASDPTDHIPLRLHFTDRECDLMTSKWSVIAGDGTVSKFKELVPPETEEERTAFESKWDMHIQAEKELDERCAEGLALFGKYFRALWS